MDLLYSDRCFRRYFNFLDKYRMSDEIMQEQPFAQKLGELVNTLRLNSNKTQVHCCMYELADILDKAQSAQIELINDDDIHKVVLDNMNRHVTDRDIQRDGIFSLYHLMKGNKEVQYQLIKSRLHYSIVQRMSTFQNDVIIQAIGCRIIHILVTLNNGIKQDIIAMNAVDVITNAIANFDNEDELQLWALQALTHLLQSKPEEQDRFLQQHYARLVLDRCEKLIEYSLIYKGCLHICMFIVLFTKGVYIYIIKAMKKHEQIAGVQQYGCQSLRILCLPKVENMKIVIGHEAWDSITNCFTSFKDDAKVFQEAIAIVACFATDLEVIRNQCAIEQLHVPVLKSIQMFPNDVTLIEMAFEAIGVFAACEAMPDLLVSEGVVEAFLGAMNRHVHNIGIQQKGCILTQVFSSYLMDSCTSAVSSVIMAMLQFPRDECVQAEACVALKLIAQVLDEMKDRARILFLSPGLPDIKAHVVLNCTQETSGIQALRTKIVDLVVKCKCKGHSILGSRVPQKFVKLQELIEKVVNDIDGNRRLLTRTELKRLMQDNDVFMTESELGQAVKFLHEAGVLLHYDDPVTHLNDLFFTDPVWLSHVVSSVVLSRKPSGLVTNGIITRKDLIGFMEDDNSVVVLNFLPQFLRLLQRFGILLPISESEFLVSSRLQARPPASVTLPDLTSNCFYRRFYQMAFKPLGFWARLITRLLLFLPMMHSDKEYQDSSNSPFVEYWQSGIQVRWSSQSYFTVFQDISDRFGVNVLAIAVPINNYGSYLLGSLVDHVDALIEEWFPNLCDLDPVQGLPLVSRLCPCITCEGDNCHVFSLEECIEQALRYEDVVCPRTSELLPVEKVSPDVELADLKVQNLLIEDNELMLVQKKELVLGDGGFGTVYKAKYNDQIVAVKVFHTEGHINPHRLLRQEVPFLAHLRHPSIITLIGVCVRPRALILEVAPLGSLSSLLNKGEVLSRGLQQRIALQVAEGLAYVHRHRIVYRDMKPHNILMFSMSLSIVINAKISDFGIARYTTMYGLKSAEGTPGYRAPEVVQGDVAYNKEADMYSFGMLLYELVTGGRRPFEDLRFRNELDAAVMQGRMIDPITDNGSSPWPDIEDLIDHLLEPRADMRPTAEQVVERLSTAELLCLKRVVAVSKEKAVECIAVRSDGDNMELWMGSGVSGNYGGQVSWLSLTDSKNEGCQGTGIDDKRVTSMTAVHNDRILVGTQSGTIWVFDALSHTCSHSLQRLPDSVISLRHYVTSHEDLVLAGLANGSLVIYKTNELKNPQASRHIISLCKTEKDGGECLDNCHVHPVACISIAQRCIYCGCGNDIVVFKLDQNSVVLKRRWSIEDRRKQCVLNIAVGSFMIWTSTKDSPQIDFWDISQPVLRGTVNCATLANTSGIEGESRDFRVVCMMLYDQTALWVGLGTGHVIVLSPKTREALYVVKRHTGTVRCMAVACRSSMHGRPVSLVITGGMGFIERPQCSGKDGDKDGDFGHVLVWEADLAEQSKRLHTDKMKRQLMPCID
ncbi:hypothetical protein QZH41_017526 [Actinostola sp. cb2023]|nr:hypothetical protein QZH41_017526 [Actinostola sp. cb2023]